MTRGSRKRLRNPRYRTLNRVVLMSCAVFVPLYLVIRLTGGSAEKLEKLPDLLERVKNPLVWEVPGDGVRYLQYFKGEPVEGYKFVLVTFRMQARMKIGYPIVTRCFRLVDDTGTMHYPCRGRRSSSSAATSSASTGTTRSRGSCCSRSPPNATPRGSCSTATRNRGACRGLRDRTADAAANQRRCHLGEFPSGPVFRFRVSLEHAGEAICLGWRKS